MELSKGRSNPEKWNLSKLLKHMHYALCMNKSQALYNTHSPVKGMERKVISFKGPCNVMRFRSALTLNGKKRMAPRSWNCVMRDKIKLAMFEKIYKRKRPKTPPEQYAVDLK